MMEISQTVGCHMLLAALASLAVMARLNTCVQLQTVVDSHHIQSNRLLAASLLKRVPRSTPTYVQLDRKRNRSTEFVPCDTSASSCSH